MDKTTSYSLFNYELNFDMFILFIHRSVYLCFFLWQNIWTSEQKDKSTEVWWLSYNHLHSQLRTTFTLWLYTRKRTVGDDHICKLECKEIKIPYNIIDSFFNLLFKTCWWEMKDVGSHQEPEEGNFWHEQKFI